MYVVNKYWYNPNPDVLISNLARGCFPDHFTTLVSLLSTGSLKMRSCYAQVRYIIVALSSGLGRLGRKESFIHSEAVQFSSQQHLIFYLSGNCMKATLDHRCIYARSLHTSTPEDVTEVPHCKQGKIPSPQSAPCQICI